MTTTALVALITTAVAALCAFLLGRRGGRLPNLGPAVRDTAAALTDAAVKGAAAKVELARQRAEQKQQEAEDAAKKAAKDASNVSSLADYLNSHR